MKKTIILGICILSTAFIACSRDDEIVSLPAKPQPPPPVEKPKPLPECESQSKLKVVWENSGRAYNYEIQMGVSESATIPPAAYPDTHFRPEAALGTEFDLELRGRWYHLISKRNSLVYEFNYVTHQVYLPTCEERELWQVANPDYTEPLIYKPFN